MPPGDNTKNALRREIREQARRQERAGDFDFAAASGAIRGHLSSWLQSMEKLGTVAFFAALPGEPDLLPLMVGHPGIRWALPRVVGCNLAWYAVTTGSPMISGEFGIREPDPETAEPIQTGKIDLILVPGIAFDPSSGVRLGRGKGYYDRALAVADPRAVTIGVAFGWQMRDRIPTEPHDLPMKGIVSESGLRWMGAAG